MKKLLIVVTSLLLATSLFAQTQLIAMFPFIGSKVTDTEQGEFLTGLFTAEFISLGYTVVSRTTGLGVAAAERHYQTTGATAEIAEIGKNIAADYVLVGFFSSVYGQTSLKVEVIEVESSQIIASETQRVTDMSNLDGVAVKIVRSLDWQIRPEKKIIMRDEHAIRRDLRDSKNAKWIGRWAWIGGAVVTAIGGIVVGTAPDSSPDYDDYDAYKATSDTSDSHFIVGYTLIGIGGVAIIAGVITDIVFSGRENKLQEELETQRIYLSATPIINSDLVSGNMNYSVQFALKYSF